MQSPEVNNVSSPPESAATLWLPLSSPKWAWTTVGGVAVVLVASMSRDLSLFDSAELAMVAAQGGLSHPIGQPLHTMLGFLISHIPGLAPLIGLNLLSALPAALSLIPLISIVESMVGAPPRMKLVLPTLAVMTLHPTIWENATRVEVYSLATFLALWSVARVAASIRSTDQTNRGWLAAGIVLGLASAANAIIALIAALGLAPMVVIELLRRRVSIFSALRAVGGGVLGLLPYLYIPLVAGREGVFIWGLPRDVSSLSWYFRGADYGHNREVTWTMVGEHLVEWFPWAATAGLLPLLILGVTAHVLWGGRAGLGRIALPTMLGLSVFMLATNAIFIPEIPDFAGYLAAPALLACAGAAALVSRVADSGPQTSRQKRLAGALALALIASVWLSPPQLSSRTRHRDRVARTLAAGVLEQAPRQAIIVVGSDHWLFPLLYLQEVERTRLDVTVLAEGLAGSSWYWPQLYSRHPDLEPIVLRAPGGTPARIRRFLSANSERPVLYETWDRAAAYGRPGCVGPWLVMDERSCHQHGGTTDDALTPAMERALEEIGAGSPVTDAVIARVTRERGEALWRFGRSDEALRALRAGVPRDLLPPSPRGAVAVTPLRGPPIQWPDETLLIGAPWQNLVVAARMFGMARDADMTRRYQQAAMEAGMPLSRERRR